MSGFLDRLAERALGGGAATRPVLPRRFAPLPPGADPDREFWQRALARQAERSPQDRPQDPPHAERTGPAESGAGEPRR